MTSCSVVRLSTDRNLSNGNAGASLMCEECHGPMGRGPDYREMSARILRNRGTPSGLSIDSTGGTSGFPEVGQTDPWDNNDTRRSCKETRGLEASSSATEAGDRNATAGSRKPRISPGRAGASLASSPGIERDTQAGWLELAGEDTVKLAVAEPGREYRLKWQTPRGTKRDPRLSVMGTAAALPWPGALRLYARGSTSPGSAGTSKRARTPAASSATSITSSHNERRVVSLRTSL